MSLLNSVVKTSQKPPKGGVGFLDKAAQSGISKNLAAIHSLNAVTKITVGSSSIALSKLSWKFRPFALSYSLLVGFFKSF